MLKVRPQVTIYTDGAAEPNPGPGGYGVVLLFGTYRKELSAGYRMTTNNRMEMMAAIVGLRSLKRECTVTLYSDSKYLVDAMSQGWAERWRSNGWMRNKKDKAQNPDLWEELLMLSQRHSVEFKWVRGHSGNPENERCDQLAVAAITSSDLLSDPGYEPTNPNTPVATQTSLTEPGQPCRKCGTALVRRTPSRKKQKPDQSYYFEWYLFCPSCRTMYMVESAKRFIE